MTTPLQLNFGNLPLVEAVVRATFSEPITLTFSAINETQKALKDLFPLVEEPVGIEAAPGVSATVEFSPGHITGVVFSGNEHGLRATIQSCVAVVRWVKRFTNETSEYPRFAALQSAIWKVAEAIEGAFKRDSFPIAVVNMSYVNFIPVTDFSSVLADYFSPLVQVRATDKAEEIRKVEVAWRESGLDLRFCLEKVSATVGDQKLDGCRLTTAAGTHVTEPNDTAKNRLDEVHDRLQVLFHDVISERAKKEWKLKGWSNG